MLCSPSIWPQLFAFGNDTGFKQSTPSRLVGEADAVQAWVSLCEEISVVPDKSWVGVAVYPDRVSAEASLSRVRDSGIPAYISSDEHVPGLGSSFSVVVPQESLHRAQSILQQAQVSEEELTWLALGKLPGSPGDETP